MILRHSRYTLLTRLSESTRTWPGAQLIKTAFRHHIETMAKARRRETGSQVWQAGVLKWPVAKAAFPCTCVLACILNVYGIISVLACMFLLQDAL
jgi:hypothetical protein